MLTFVLTLCTVLLAAPVLFYLPGLLLSRIAHLPGDTLVRHYERVIISVLLSGWLALLLAELGIFSLWLHLLIALALCGGVLVATRSGSSRGRLSPPATPDDAPPGNRETTASAALVPWVVVGVVALLLVIRPFETVLGVRDAGVYANSGFALARTGSLVQHNALIEAMGQAAQSNDPALRGPAEQALSNFLGVQNRERFIATRLQTAGYFIHEGDVVHGRIVPQHLHLTAVWIGLLTSVAGMYAGLFAPGLMGVLGAWSVGMLGRQLVSNRVGWLAFLFLALNSVQVWFARSSTSETTAQMLTFAGFYFFARFQTLQTDEDATPPGNVRRAAIIYAGVAGVAFGQLALNRIDFVLVVVPLMVYLVYCFVAHRWRATHTALSIALGIVLLHAALHVFFIARAYALDTAFARLQDFAITSYLVQPFLTPVLREVYYTTDRSPFKDPLQIWREVVVLMCGLAVLLALWRWPQPLHAVERWLRHWRGWLVRGGAVAVVVLAFYGYLVRPQILMQVHWPDPFARYEAGLNALMEQLQQQSQLDDAALPPAEHLLNNIDYTQQYAEALIYRQRLMKNIELTRRKESDNAQLEVERTHLLAELDRFSTATVGVSFEQLSAMHDSAPQAQGPWPVFDIEPITALPRCLLPHNWSQDGVCLRLQGYIGAPIALPEPPAGLDEKYMIPSANFVRFGWYLSPLGVALGVLGFALWWLRGVNCASWFFLVIGFLGTFFFIRDTYGTSDQSYIYILRRFVPMGYPMLSLGMAYLLAGGARQSVTETGTWRWSAVTGRRSFVILRGVLVLAMVAFFVWTGRPIYRHVEYHGALEQFGTFAAQFDEDTVLLFRGGGPTYHEARDVPDVVVTPLNFGFGVDAFTVKSSQPGAYAGALASQVHFWQTQGRSVYVALSASGGNFALPGFQLEPAGSLTLDVPEFEQLTNQKPKNIARLRLPFAVYRLTAGEPGHLATLPTPLTATDFAAQVRGFYLAEPATESMAYRALSEDTYAWTDGDALLRLAWRAGSPPQELVLHVAGGQRPPHLGPARLCLSLLPETTSWIGQEEGFIPLECIVLRSEMASYPIDLAHYNLPPSPTGSALLRLESDAWVPAEEDPHQHDWRLVGVQFGGVSAVPR